MIVQAENVKKKNEKEKSEKINFISETIKPPN